MTEIESANIFELEKDKNTLKERWIEIISVEKLNKNNLRIVEQLSYETLSKRCFDFGDSL